MDRAKKMASDLLGSEKKKPKKTEAQIFEKGIEKKKKAINNKKK